MSGKPDRQLVVRVDVGGYVDTSGNPWIGVEYCQSRAFPKSKNKSVDDLGEVDLENLDYDPSKHQLRTGIIFNLCGVITDSAGKKLEFGFPADLSKAVEIKQGGVPTTTKLKARAGSDPKKQLIIDDDDDDGLTYTYCLGIHIATAAAGGTMVKLDPSIHNRPL